MILSRGSIPQDTAPRLMHPTSQPIATPEPAPLRVWFAALGLAVLALGALELTFRSGLVWRLPLSIVLKEPDDIHGRTAWRIYNVKPDPNHIMVLGSSMADAVVEPGGKIKQNTIDAVLGPNRASILNLSSPRSCFAEQTVITENAVRQGHRPQLVLIFSYPGCLSGDGAEDDRDAVLAQRIPLTSQFLDARVPSSTIDDTLGRWLTQNVALVRFRHFGNSWMRQRARMALHGQFIYPGFRARSRARPWTRPWDQDVPRLARLRQHRAAFNADNPNTRSLVTLLTYLRDHNIRAAVVEGPWSPPVHEHFGDVYAQYAATLDATTAAYGAKFVDLNRRVQLQTHHFNDSWHVSYAGADVYFTAMVNWLSEELE